MNWSLRSQLLRQSAIASAIILVITAMALYGLMRMSLYAEFDAALLVEAKSLASHVEQSGDKIKVEISLDTMPEFIRQDQPHYFQIWDSGGTTVAKSASLADVSMLPRPRDFGTNTFTPLRLPSNGSGRGVHFAFKPHNEDSEYLKSSLGKTQETNSEPLLTLVVARPIQELDRTLAKLAWLLTFVTSVATCVTTLIMNGVIKKGFKSLECVAQNIELIGVNDLSGRIELQSVPSEVLPITKRINELMTRLESTLNREKSFSADVAHELRTPLAGLQTALLFLANRERNRDALRIALNANSDLRYLNSRCRTRHQSWLESLEPRHLMAAVPIAKNDAAFYTGISTDLDVSTSSNPAHLLANDLDIDGGAITYSTLVKTGGNTFTLTNKTGVISNFSTTGLLTSIVDTNSNTNSFAYADRNSDGTESITALGFVSTIRRNMDGLPIVANDPDPDGTGPLTSPVTNLAHDSYGRLVTLTNPDASTQTFSYNTANQVLTSVDELGKTTTNVYDSLGRQTSVTNRVSAVTQFGYDAMSRNIKQTDPLGNVIDIEFNNRGWMSKITYPDPDGAGSLSRPEDSRTFDASGNVISRSSPDSYFVGSYPFTFNADNRMLTKVDVMDSSIVENWRYDNAGRLINNYRAGTLGESADRTALEYDAAGRVLAQKIQSSDGYNTIYAQATMTYTLAGQLATQTDGRGYTTSRTYNSRGLVATETLPDADGDGSQFSLIVSHTYDNMGRETSLDRGFARITAMEYNSRSLITVDSGLGLSQFSDLAAPFIARRKVSS